MVFRTKSNASAVLAIDGSNNPNVTINGNLTYDCQLGDLTDTFGNGDLTVSGTILLDNGGAGTLTYTGGAGDVSCAHLTCFIDGAGALTVDLATNDPTITVAGNFTLTESAGTLTFSHGDNPIEVQGNIEFTAGAAPTTYNANPSGGPDFTLSGLANQTVDTDGVTIGDVKIDKTTSGNVEFGGTSTTNCGLESVDMAGSLSWTDGDHSSAAADDKTIEQDFTITSGTFNMGSADWTIGGSVTIGGTVTYNKGSGQITITGNCTLTSGGKALEAITVTGGTFTQADGLTCDGLEIRSGATWDPGSSDLTVDNSGNLTIQAGADVTTANLDGRTWTVAGDALFKGRPGPAANKLDMAVTGGTLTVTVTGTLTGRYISLDNCDASGGTSGIAWDSTDGGSNTEWTFRATPSKQTGTSGRYSRRPVMLSS
jgi:hypothetical protein